MIPENEVRVITDTGSSIRGESTLVKELEVVSVPLDIKFFENNSWVSYQDTDISPEEFYRKMRLSNKLPQTSGAIPGKLLRIYDAYAKEEHPIISIHVTAHHSSVWESAILASNMAKEINDHLLIEVIDSKTVSLATWFLVEQAAILAKQGFPLEDIKKITLETIPKVEVFTSLHTLENLAKGGRLSSAANYLGSKLQIRPIAGLVDGEIKLQSIHRTDKKTQAELINRVERINGEIVKLAIVHTNNIESAQLLKEKLSAFYSNDIGIYEAGPVLGVHVGEKGLGIALQKA